MGTIRTAFLLLFLGSLLKGCVIGAPKRVVVNNTVYSSANPEVIIRVDKSMQLAEATPRKTMYAAYDADTDYVSYHLGGGTSAALQLFVFESSLRMLVIEMQELTEGVFLGIRDSHGRGALLSGDLPTPAASLYFDISIDKDLVLRDRFYWQSGFHGENLMVISYLEPLNMIDAKRFPVERWQYPEMFEDDQKSIILDFKNRAEKAFSFSEMSEDGLLLIKESKEIEEPEEGKGKKVKKGKAI